MCSGIHYGEVEGLVSVERWSSSRSASCVAEYTHYGEVEGLVSVERWSCNRGASQCAYLLLWVFIRNHTDDVINFKRQFILIYTLIMMDSLHLYSRWGWHM